MTDDLDVAVEAAARAECAQDTSERDAPTGPDCPLWPQHLDSVRPLVEAAAPHLRAQAVQWRDDGGLRLVSHGVRDRFTFGQLRDGADDVVQWLELPTGRWEALAAAIHNSGQYKRMWAMLNDPPEEPGESDDPAVLRARWEAEVRASERAKVAEEIALALEARTGPLWPEWCAALAREHGATEVGR